MSKKKKPPADKMDVADLLKTATADTEDSLRQVPTNGLALLLTDFTADTNAEVKQYKLGKISLMQELAVVGLLYIWNRRIEAAELEPPPEMPQRL